MSSMSCSNKHVSSLTNINSFDKKSNCKLDFLIQQKYFDVKLISFTKSRQKWPPWSKVTTVVAVNRQAITFVFGSAAAAQSQLSADRVAERPK